VFLVGKQGSTGVQTRLNRDANKACLGCKGDLFGVRLRLVWSGRMMLFGQNWAQFGGLLGHFGVAEIILPPFNLYFASFQGGAFSAFNILQKRYLHDLKGLLTNKQAKQTVVGADLRAAPLK
jgi:hypothetical protein